MLMSSGTAGTAARETAGPDSFVIYGGPDRIPEGRFELGDGVTPDWGSGNGLPGGYGGGPGAWTPVDMTEDPVYWHQSTFNAENLNSNGAGNNALWSGIAPGDPAGEGYARLPGYGNSWFDVALYTSSPVADPSSGQVVDLEFFFNYDVWDATWDFLSVQYDLDGVWTTVMEVTGYSRDGDNIFQSPGVLFSAEQEAPIVYAGNDYGGPDGDRIRIRLLVTSDGGWSDEDIGGGLAGAAQVDDITLTTSQGTFFEDFEGPGPYLFKPTPTNFAGDFADVYPSLTDPDPCRQNPTPVAGFIDYGQVLRNGPGPDGVMSTGGSTSPGIEYGIPGNFVVNYTGGIAAGESSLDNEIWSPDILWDLPGPDDDDASIAGAALHFDVWVDLPLVNAIFYRWHVRSDDGSGYGPWRDRNYIYYDGGNEFPAARDWPTWFTHTEGVTDLLEPAPQRVQIALGVTDFADLFGFPGTAATPSPVFDNVRFTKHRLQGPVIAARTVDLAQDGFPVSGTLDASTQAGRDAMDVPFSMAQDVNTGMLLNVPGDSIVVDVESMIPGSSLVDVRMVWALNTNRVFEDAIRTAPAGPNDENVVAGPAEVLWTGEVVGVNPTYALGQSIPDRFFLDLPDVDFMYPGDVLHYYIRAEDSDGRVSTLPADISGFGYFGLNANYDRTFRVRCLPTLTDTSGSQPPVLVYNGFGRRGGEEAWHEALRQLYGDEGIDYDSYTVMGPTTGSSNGIGSAGAHGATVAQLAGYENLLCFFGYLSRTTLSNGSDVNDNTKSDDLGLLEQWHALAGPRNVAYFGDHFASGLKAASPEGASYLADVLGVNAIGPDVGPSLGGQTSPLVVPNATGTFAAAFETDFVAYGGCDVPRNFDRISPLVGAEAGHYFTDTNGVPIVDESVAVASVVHALPNGLAMTFPFDPAAIMEPATRMNGLPARALAIKEILNLFDALWPWPPVAAPEMRRVVLSVAPNPFNPVTTISFTARPGSKGSVKVFNLRGELVRTLHSGEFAVQEFTWDGTDRRGASVSSGVYVIQAEAEGKAQTMKVALVK